MSIDLHYSLFKNSITANFSDKTIGVFPFLLHQTNDENNEFACQTESTLFYLRNDSRNKFVIFLGHKYRGDISQPPRIL